MFINELFEATDPYTLVVTYPGRFQPFHLGHDQVYKKIQAMFRGGNVYVATSNDQKDEKSPFSFSDKVQFMTALGVHQDRIIETNMMYALPEQFKNIANKVLFVTVVGEPDRDRLHQDTILKRDNPKTGKRAGDPGYYKTFHKGEPMESADQHGYVLVMPEEKKFIKLNGEQVDVSHGTQTRNTWNLVRNDPKLRSEFLVQLYGRNDPELGRILDKIPDNNPVVSKPKTLGNQAKLQKVEQPKDKHIAEGGVGVVANKKQTKDPRYSMSLTKDVRPGQINKSLRAFSLAEDLEWVKSKLGEGAVDKLIAQHIEYINQDIAKLKQRIATEQLPANYVESLKQKIADLETERAKLAFNPT